MYVIKLKRIQVLMFTLFFSYLYSNDFCPKLFNMIYKYLLTMISFIYEDISDSAYYAKLCFQLAIQICTIRIGVACKLKLGGDDEWKKKLGGGQ